MPQLDAAITVLTDPRLGGPRVLQRLKTIDDRVPHCFIISFLHGAVLLAALQVQIQSIQSEAIRACTAPINVCKRIACIGRIARLERNVAVL